MPMWQLFPHFNIRPYKYILSNLYIKGTEGTLKLEPLWAFVFYMQVQIT
jgi:hypothetical protein